MERKPFVVVEGGSGSGKTTAIRGIQPALEGWKFFREPGGTDFGELMRVAVQETHGIEIDPMAAFMAYSASRANLVRCEILPVLDGLREGKGALLDRYWYSTYAYQGGEGIEKEIIVQVSNMVTNDLVPELVLHYDLAPELAILRKDGCLDIDRYDMKKLEFHVRVREAYLELAYRYRDFWRVIDASKSKEEVLKDSLTALAEFGMI